MSDEAPILSPMSPGAAEAYLRDKKSKRHVCACGHPKAYHHFSEALQEWGCSPLKSVCFCKKPSYILESEYLRSFLQQTDNTAVGLDHALSKGILHCNERGRVWRWLGANGWPSCHHCGVETQEPIPVAYNIHSERISYGSSGEVNYVVCPTCYVNVERKDG